MHRRSMLAALLAAGAAAPGLAPAAGSDGDYPSRPVTLVIPAPAGGGLDMIARALAEEMARSLKQPVIVDNRPGAGGVIATHQVVRSAPDGYTITLTLTQAVLNNLFLVAKMPYDPRRDLAFVSEICTGQVVMVANAALPVGSPKKLLAWAAQHPDRASYGSWGAGSYGHIVGAHLGRTRHVAMVHVPYKGEAPMLQDLVGGQIAWAMASLASSRPHIDAGRLKLLAVTGDKRLDDHPQVPTFAQAGLPDVELRPTGSVLLMAPAATPPAVLARLEKESLAALATPTVRARLQLAGFIPVGAGRAEARANYDALYPVQEQLFKGLGFKPE